jgi:hypothetical protein
MATASAFTLRPATSADVEEIFRLIVALAEYEHLTGDVEGSAARLREHLFGPRPRAEVVVAESAGRTVGFALFFHSYSSFLTAPGLWLEDLFVEPEHRGHGIGTALLRRVAAVAVERGCRRLEWAVLDWNTPAIRFYERRGTVMADWRTCRLEGEALARLGAR